MALTTSSSASNSADDELVYLYEGDENTAEPTLTAQQQEDGSTILLANGQAVARIEGAPANFDPATDVNLAFFTA